MAYRGLALQAGRAEMQPVVAGMEGAVEYGTAQRAGVSGVKVAGKTGSVRTEAGAPIAWFAGFVPSRAPEVVVTVMLQGHSGGSDAAPVAGRVPGSVSGGAALKPARRVWRPAVWSLACESGRVGRASTPAAGLTRPLPLAFGWRSVCGLRLCGAGWQPVGRLSIGLRERSSRGAGLETRCRRGRLPHMHWGSGWRSPWRFRLGSIARFEGAGGLGRAGSAPGALCRRRAGGREQRVPVGRRAAGDGRGGAYLCRSPARPALGRGLRFLRHHALPARGHGGDHAASGIHRGRNRGRVGLVRRQACVHTVYARLRRPDGEGSSGRLLHARRH